MAEENEEYVELEKEEKKAPEKPVKKKRQEKGSWNSVRKRPPKRAAKKTEIKDLLETDIDKLYELTREKGIVKLKEASKQFGIDSDQIEEWGRILEDHGLVKMHYPPVGEPVLILKKFKSDTEDVKKLEKKKKLKPGKKVFIVNIVILLIFIIIISFFTIRIPAIRISYNQTYLILGAVIIIVAVIFYVLFRKLKRKGHEEKG